jgi:DNA-binding PadR family transcriptional regulator
VRTAILVLLAEEPRNGYQLMGEIEKRSEGAWRPSPGSMYPALQQLEDEGLVRVETAAGGRTFHLTDKGREQVKAQQKEPAPWEVASDEVLESAADLRELFRQVALAAMQVGQAGTAAQIAEARKVLAQARKALYRILAEDDQGDEE